MYDAIVVAGGAARRLGSVDKPALLLAGSSLLDHVLAAVADAERTVVVGPERDVARAVHWCREQPPGGGPVAALAAGFRHVRADVVVVLAADLPWIAPAVVALQAALGDGPADAALLVDSDGRVNHLAAAWRRPALGAALAAVGEPAGAPAHRVLAGTTYVTVLDPHGWGRDCDTWDDLAAARREADDLAAARREAQERSNR